MKFCNLKKQPCGYLKDQKDYANVKEPICNLQAMTIGKPFEISKMTDCPQFPSLEKRGEGRFDK